MGSPSVRLKLTIPVQDYWQIWQLYAGLGYRECLGASESTCESYDDEGSGTRSVSG